MRGTELARLIGRGTASVAIALVPAHAHADEPCARVTAPGDLSPTWAAALDDLRKQIALLAASDCQPMTLSIVASGGGVRIVATTTDGRRAERGVGHADSLVATALGLLIAIPAQGSPPLSAPPASAPSPSFRATDLPPAPSPVADARKIALWTGLSGGLRLTVPTAATVVDVEARTDLLIDRWLLLATIRSALVSCIGSQGFDCDSYSDVSLGVGVGRRLPAGASAIDIALEPSIVAMHMEYDAVPESEGESVSGTVVALRVDASARLAVPIGQRWAVTLTIDAGLAPALLANPTRLEVPANIAATAGTPPAFPAWTGGLRVGASGALL